MTRHLELSQDQTLSLQYPCGTLDTQLFLRLRESFGKNALTILEGPLGHGKTTLLSKLRDCSDSDGIKTFWIGLSNNDKNLGDLALLFRKAAVGLGSAKYALPKKTDPVNFILSLLSHRKEPLRIFIDDLGNCRDRSLGKLLDAFLLEPSGRCQFVVATSRRLDFNVVRGSTEGRLLHLGSDDLQFSRGDIAALATKHSLTLSETTIDRILEKTEGWPMAVALLIKIIEDSDNPTQSIATFSGEDRELSAQLRHELLNSQDGRYVQFLLETAYLQELSYEACRNLTGEDRAKTYLNTMSEENAFVFALDRNGRRLRMHCLLKEFLKLEAERRIPSGRREVLLARASEWYRRNERFSDAMSCALDSPSSDLISRTLHLIAPVVVGQKGDFALYTRWVQCARNRGICLSMESDYWYTWALLFSRQPESAYEQSTVLWERYVRGEMLSEPPEAVESFLRKFEELRILVNVFREDLTEAGMEGRKWLGSPSSANNISTATVSCAVAIYATTNFDFRAARDAIQTAYSGINATVSDYGQAWVSALSAQIDFYEGEYSHCLAVLESAYTKAEERLGPNANIVLTISVLRACCLSEMGRRDEARTCLSRCLASLPSHGVSEIAFCGVETAMEIWNGRQDDVFSPSSIISLLASYAQPMSFVAHCFLIRKLLHLDRVEEAHHFADFIGVVLDDPDAAASISPEYRTQYVCELKKMTHLEYFVAHGMHQRVCGLCAEMLKEAEAFKRRGQVVKLQVIRACSAQKLGDMKLARSSLYRAIRIAGKRRIVRPFLEHLECVQEIIRHVPPRDWLFVDPDEQALFDSLGHSRRARRLSSIKPQASEETASDPPEALTARELDLLRYASAGLSNQQIADGAGITLSTVKWHFYKIYAKLNVKNRSSAVMRARNLTLIA
jgi:LuxR family maltose regulon positive regulatory protein